MSTQLVIDLELDTTSSLGPRHVVKSIEGNNTGGVVEFCSWGRLADEFVERSRNPPKSVHQIKVDAVGVHFYLVL